MCSLLLCLLVSTVPPGGPQLRVEEVPLVRLLAGVPGGEGEPPDVGHVVVCHGQLPAHSTVQYSTVQYSTVQYSHGQLPAHPGPASPYIVCIIY